MTHMSLIANGVEISSLVDGKYGIQDLVDIPALTSLFEQFSVATGFTIGFLDHPAKNILIQTGWKRICTEFHRCSAASEEKCLTSNRRLLDSLKKSGETIIDLCDHGLVDCAIPIVIDGKHIASLSTGQMLLQKADIERYKQQAKSFGFDEASYLDALSEVEVVDEKKLRSATQFLASMAQMITESGYSRLRTTYEFAERNRVEVLRQQAEERFRLIFEKSDEAIVFGWADSRAELINAAASQLFGINADGRALARSDFVDVTDPRLSAALAERQRMGTSKSELRCLRQDGTMFPAEVVSTCFTRENGEQRTISFFRDISERYEKERALQESLNALNLRNQALGSISQGVLITGPDRLINYANDAFVTMTGYSVSEIAGLPCSILQGPDTSADTVKKMRAALEAEKPFHAEILNYRRDGTPFWNDLSITPVFGDDGELTQFVGVQRDITARKKADVDLRESRSLIATFFDSLDDMVAVINERGIIVAINKAWQIFGEKNGASQTLINAIGVDYLSVLQPETVVDVEVTKARNGILAILSGNLQRFEMEYPCHSPNERRFFNMRVFPLMGELFGALIVHENISERKKIEYERDQDSHRLTILSRRLVAVQEDNRRRLARELHDRTSPNLAAISINMDVAELAMDSKDWEEVQVRMSDNRGLIEDTAASIREICADLRPPALDYAGLVPAMEGYANQFSRRTGLQVRISCQNSVARFTAECESILFRIYQEALTNIAKHARATAANISLDQDDRNVTLTVADNGLGFNRDALAETSGQGLINMREMAEFAGGELDLQTILGAGTKVIVRIRLQAKETRLFS